MTVSSSTSHPTRGADSQAASAESSLPSDWRIAGQSYRKRLLQEDHAAQRRWTDMDPSAPMESYLEIADKVLERFLDHSIDTQEDLLNAYMIGVRLQTFLNAMKQHPMYMQSLNQQRHGTLARELAGFLEPMELMIDEQQYQEQMQKCIQTTTKATSNNSKQQPSWQQLEARLEQALLASPLRTQNSNAVEEIGKDETSRSLSPIPFQDESISIDIPTTNIPKLAPAPRDRAVSTTTTHNTVSPNRINGVLKPPTFQKIPPAKTVTHASLDNNKRLRFKERQEEWDADWTNSTKNRPMAKQHIPSTRDKHYAPSRWSREPQMYRDNHITQPLENVRPSVSRLPSPTRMSIEQIRSRVLEASRRENLQPVSSPVVFREEQPSDEISPVLESKIARRFTNLKVTSSQPKQLFETKNDPSPQSVVSFPVTWNDPNPDLPEWDVPEEESSPIRVPRKGLLVDDHLRLADEFDNNSMIHEFPSHRRRLQPFKQCVRCFLN